MHHISVYLAPLYYAFWSWQAVRFIFSSEHIFSSGGPYLRYVCILLVALAAKIVLPLCSFRPDQETPAMRRVNSFKRTQSIEVKKLHNGGGRREGDDGNGGVEDTNYDDGFTLPPSVEDENGDGESEVGDADSGYESNGRS
ncbi:hypothetical protein F4810DRAFT_710003 [Camillea tinctor]|nr:hypothetical protein F4810DRAFT_710003 [Camillea tinctor]